MYFSDLLYQGVVPLDQGSVIIRDKLPEFVKKKKRKSEAANSALPRPCFQHGGKQLMHLIIVVQFKAR